MSRKNVREELNDSIGMPPLPEERDSNLKIRGLYSAKDYELIPIRN